MNIVTTMRILGILLMLFSITMMPSILISVLYKDGAGLAFVTAMAISFFTGFFAWLPVRNVRRTENPGWLFSGGFILDGTESLWISAYLLSRASRFELYRLCL